MSLAQKKGLELRLSIIFAFWEVFPHQRDPPDAASLETKLQYLPQVKVTKETLKLCTKAGHNHAWEWADAEQK